MADLLLRFFELNDWHWNLLLAAKVAVSNARSHEKLGRKRAVTSVEELLWLLDRLVEAGLILLFHRSFLSLASNVNTSTTKMSCWRTVSREEKRVHAFQS